MRNHVSILVVTGSLCLLITDLAVLKELIEAGTLRPVIDQTFPLHETPAALRHIKTGHARGKVVITVT